MTFLTPDSESTHNSGYNDTTYRPFAQHFLVDEIISPDLSQNHTTSFTPFYTPPSTDLNGYSLSSKKIFNGRLSDSVHPVPHQKAYFTPQYDSKKGENTTKAAKTRFSEDIFSPSNFTSKRSRPQPCKPCPENFKPKKIISARYDPFSKTAYSDSQVHYYPDFKCYEDKSAQEQVIKPVQKLKFIEKLAIGYAVDPDAPALDDHLPYNHSSKQHSSYCCGDWCSLEAYKHSSVDTSNFACELFLTDSRCQTQQHQQYLPYHPIFF